MHTFHSTLKEFQYGIAVKYLPGETPTYTQHFLIAPPLQHNYNILMFLKLIFLIKFTSNDW